MAEDDGLTRVDGVICDVDQQAALESECQPIQQVTTATSVTKIVANVKRFQPGKSGNPGGRPKGAKSKTNVIIKEWFDSTLNALKVSDVPNPLSIFAQFMMDETKNDKIRLAAAIEFGKYVLPRPEPEQKVVHEHYNVPETKEQLMLRLQEIYNTFNVPQIEDKSDGE